MKKTSVSTVGSDNLLSYRDQYEEITKYKRRFSNKSHVSKKSKITNTRKISISDEGGREIVLSRGVRWFLFVLFIILQLLMNVDHGTFPAATEEIRSDLDIDDYILGIFGSLVFLGNLIGIFF